MKKYLFFLLFPAVMIAGSSSIETAPVSKQTELDEKLNQEDDTLQVEVTDDLYGQVKGSQENEAFLEGEKEAQKEPCLENNSKKAQENISKQLNEAAEETDPSKAAL